MSQIHISAVAQDISFGEYTVEVRVWSKATNSIVAQSQADVTVPGSAPASPSVSAPALNVA